jgi:hypothetical protein
MTKFISDEDKIYSEFETFMETTYPEFFKHQLYGGFSIGIGWFQLLRDLFAKINEYVVSERNNGNVIEMRVAQIKEKFGELRVYVDGADDHIAHLIREAEKVAYATCELCGKPATHTKKGWLQRLCDGHAKS